MNFMSLIVTLFLWCVMISFSDNRFLAEFFCSCDGYFCTFCYDIGVDIAVKF